MDKITVDKNDLQKTLLDNKKKHVELFEEATHDYKEKTIKEAEEFLEEIKADPLKKNGFRPGGAPKSYESDYDRAIEMLEWETDSQIRLSEDDFRRYVQDDWDWKDHFNHSYLMSTGKFA